MESSKNLLSLVDIAANILSFDPNLFLVVITKVTTFLGNLTMNHHCRSAILKIMAK